MSPNSAPGDAAHFQDEEIRAVIDHYDDPDHPDALTVSETRELLAELQTALEAQWDDLLDAVREGDLHVVRDTGTAVVLRDTERGRWNELLDEIELFDQVDRTILRVTHHQAAKRLTDQGFDGTDPIVVRKPDSAEAGQRFVEAVIERLLREDVLPNEAWAYYGIDIRGYSGEEMAERCGIEDKLAVADAVETARDQLGE